jgi:hypothetical protein
MEWKALCPSSFHFLHFSMFVFMSLCSCNRSNDGKVDRNLLPWENGFLLLMKVLISECDLQTVWERDSFFFQ